MLQSFGAASKQETLSLCKCTFAEEDLFLPGVLRGGSVGVGIREGGPELGGGSGRWGGSGRGVRTIGGSVGGGGTITRGGGGSGASV
jgi:hypothetical protein